MAKEKIARYYYRHKNEVGAGFTGVPQRDLTQSEWDDLPEHTKKAVSKSGLYYASKPEGWVSQEELDQADAKKAQAAAEAEKAAPSSPGESADAQTGEDGSSTGSTDTEAQNGAQEQKTEE